MGAHERQRLATLHATGLLDSPREPMFDDLVRVAAAAVGAPMSLVTLVDAERQWCKAALNFDLTETPRDQSFCAHAIREAGVFVIEDTAADPRFAHNPLVTEPPGVRFYAGAPMVTAEGHALGTVCVLDTEPRRIDEDQRDALRALARQAVREIGLRRALDDLASTVHGQRRIVTPPRAVGEAAIEYALDGVATLDDEGRVLRLNRAAERLVGAAEGRRLAGVLRERERFDQAWQRGELADRRTEWTLLTGRPVELTVTAVPVGDSDLHSVFVRDLTERRRLEAQLRHLAHHDPLTGLLNRARFDEELDARAAELSRYGGEAAVLMLDLDNFKVLNDEFGHQAGDRALVLVADALRSRLRDTDMVARVGGDELAALLTNTSGTAAAQVAAGLVDEIRAIRAAQLPRISASIGVAALAGDAHAAMAAADSAMYAAKRRGGDGHAVAARP